MTMMNDTKTTDKFLFAVSAAKQNAQDAIDAVQDDIRAGATTASHSRTMQELSTVVGKLAALEAEIKP